MVATRRIDIPRGAFGRRKNGYRAMEIDAAAKALYDPDFWENVRGGQKTKAVERPYEQNAWVYAGTLALGRAISGMPLRIYQGERPRLRHAQTDMAGYVRERMRAAQNAANEKRQVSDDHPLVMLFDAPCPALTRAQMWLATIIYLTIGGENFWIMVGKGGRRREKGEIPIELWPQDPKPFEPLKADGSPGVDGRTKMPASWKVGDADPYLPESLVHFNWFHPTKPHRGLSPLIPGELSLDSHYSASTFNRQFFRRGCHPGGIFEHPKALTEPQRKDFLAAISEEHEGLERAHETLLLENGVRFSWNPRSHKDMEFPQLLNLARDELLAVMGVMKSVLAITDDLNYATALGQKRWFMENTVLPVAFDLEDALYAQLFRDIDGGRYWGEFDLSGVAALQDDIQAKAATAKLFFDMGYSRDEVNARMNLGFQPDEDTDVRGGPAALGLGLDLGADMDDAAVVPEPGQGAQAGAAATLAQGGAVQDTALNGAQIQSLVDVAAKVQSGELQAETAIAIIKAAYPTIDDAEAKAIIEPAAKAAAAQPNTEPPAAVEEKQAGAAEGTPPRTAGLKWMQGAQARVTDWEAALVRMTVLLARSDMHGEALARAWREQVRIALEKAVAQAVRRYFGNLRDEQVEAFEKYIRDLGGDELTAEDIDRLVFNRAQWDEELKKILGPELKKVMGAAAKRLGKELGVPTISTTNPEMLRLHARKLATLVKVNDVTQRELRSRLIAGIAEGETIDELRLRLNETFTTLTGNDRALRVARTEVGMMQQATRFQGMKDSGVKRHKWMSVLGPDTREDHRDEHSHVVEIGTPFPVTGLLHPLQMGAPAEQVVNCDCDVLPQVEI